MCCILVVFLFLASSVHFRPVCFVVFLVGIVSLIVCVLYCFRLAAVGSMVMGSVGFNPLHFAFNDSVEF